MKIIVHKTSDSLMLAYVGHHDEACRWAERRVIDAHLKTGAIQIREVRELVSETIQPAPATQPTLPLQALAAAPSPPPSTG